MTSTTRGTTRQSDGEGSLGRGFSAAQAFFEKDAEKVLTRCRIVRIIIYVAETQRHKRRTAR